MEFTLQEIYLGEAEYTALLHRRKTHMFVFDTPGTYGVGDRVKVIPHDGHPSPKGFEAEITNVEVGAYEWLRKGYKIISLRMIVAPDMVQLVRSAVDQGIAKAILGDSIGYRVDLVMEQLEGILSSWHQEENALRAADAYFRARRAAADAWKAYDDSQTDEDCAKWLIAVEHEDTTLRMAKTAILGSDA